MKCHFCKKKGHFGRDCFEKKNATKRNEAVGNYINAEENSNQDVDNHVIALKSEESLNDSDNNDWWIDSGASQHMTPTKTHMNNYAKFNKPLVVKLADDTILHTIGKGNIRLKIRRGENVVELLLSDVLHVPKIKNNLFSIPAVINKGPSISFENEYCFISKGDKTFKIGSKSGKLYKLDISQDETCSLSKANPNTIGLWHLRFGHLGYDNVNKLISKSMVEGIDINPNEQFDQNCDGCAIGKQHKHPFSERNESEANDLLELIHSDVCGPMNIDSMGSSRYFVTFIDDYSRYTTVYMIKHKSQVTEKFKEFVLFAEKLTGKSVKQLKTDNGGEYTSNEFDQFCKQRGIEHEFTVPYTSRQNGVAERKNRTIIGTVLSMLYDTGLPLNFWAEAVSTAVYLQNRSPTTILRDVTPFERWYKKKPNVSNLKVFGCKGHVHVPVQRRKRKLDSRSIKCIFNGYMSNGKGYKLFNTENKHFIQSRDVIFLENEFETKESVELQNRKLNESNSFSDFSINFNVENDDEIEVYEIPDGHVPRRVANPPDRYGVITGDWWGFIESAAIASDISEPKTIEDAMIGANSV